MPLSAKMVRKKLLTMTLLAISLVMASFLLGPSIALLLFFLISVSLFFSELASKKLPLTQLLIKSVIFSLLLFVGISIIQYKGHPYAYVHGALTQSIESLPELFEKNEKSFQSLWRTQPDQIMQWKSQISQAAQQAPEFSSSFLRDKFFGYLTSGLLLIFCLAALILKKLGVSVTSTDFRDWKIPDHLVWAFIVSFIFNELTISTFSPVFKNVFIVVSVIYFIHGMAIASFYFQERKFSPAYKNISFALLIFFPLFTSCVGFFDLWINFRKHILKGNKSVLNS